MNYQPSLFATGEDNLPCAEIVAAIPPQYADVLIRACLGTEQQYIALRRLSGRANPSPGWFAAICAELATSQVVEVQGTLL